MLTVVPSSASTPCNEASPYELTTLLKVSKPGTLHTLALCSIHGLWEYAREIQVVE